MNFYFKKIRKSVFSNVSWLIWLINSDIYCNNKLHCWVSSFVQLSSMYDSFLCMINARLWFAFYDLFRILYIVVGNLQRFIRLSSYIFLCVSSLKQSRVITPKILHTLKYVHLKYFSSKMLPAISINCCRLSKLKNGFKNHNLHLPDWFFVDKKYFSLLLSKGLKLFLFGWFDRF